MVNCLRHHTTQRIDFLDQMPFTNTAYCGIAAHLTQCFNTLFSSNYSLLIDDKIISFVQNSREQIKILL
jgi:hypothetical protein